LSKFSTLLTDQVSVEQKSVVHGLSYTDKLINVPKAYELAAVVLIAAIWITYTLFNGQVHKVLTPLFLYFVFLVLGQVAAYLVQNFIVSPNEFTKNEPSIEHNLELTRVAYDLDDIEEKETDGAFSLTDDKVEENQLTIDNVRLNDSRPLLDVYNQLQIGRASCRERAEIGGATGAGGQGGEEGLRVSAV